MDTIFKLGDRVFDVRYGWGIVSGVNILNKDWPVEVVFNGKEELCDDYTFDGRAFINYPPTLSFTEYKLEGFSQERPEELPKQGDVVWVRDTKHGMWIVMHFIKKSGVKYVVSNNNPFTYNHTEYDEYNYLTTKNPYANEQ